MKEGILRCQVTNIQRDEIPEKGFRNTDAKIGFMRTVRCKVKG
jgi:hypothetical protein